MTSLLFLPFAKKHILILQSARQKFKALYHVYGTPQMASVLSGGVR